MQTIIKLEDITTIDQLTNFLRVIQAVAVSAFSYMDACTVGFREHWLNFGT